MNFEARGHDHYKKSLGADGDISAQAFMLALTAGV